MCELKIDVTIDKYIIPVRFVVANYPGCCGVRVIRAFNHILPDALPEKHHEKLAEILTQCMLAKGTTDIPKEAKVYASEFTGRGYQDMEASMSFVRQWFRVATIMIADAVWGECNNPSVFTMYKLALLGKWNKGTTMLNPNSGRDICTFTLNKTYVPAPHGGFE